MTSPSVLAKNCLGLSKGRAKMMSATRDTITHGMRIGTAMRQFEMT